MCHRFPVLRVVLLVVLLLPQPAESLFEVFKGIIQQFRDFDRSLCTSRNNIHVIQLALSLLLKTETYLSLIEPRRTDGDNGFVDFHEQCENAAVTTAASETRLQEMMHKLKEGSITRPNNLGLIRLSRYPFTCHDDSTIYSDAYCGIGLG